MKLYLAGEHTVKNGTGANWNKLKILESYVYAKQNKQFDNLVKSKSVDLLLDSGAFTYITGMDSSQINWDTYIEEYAAFINKYQINTFIEVDVDIIIGKKEVDRLRFKLEQLTNKIPIWVLQQGRSLNDLKTALIKYKYIAIPLSGKTTQSKKRKKDILGLNTIINICHKAGAKVHGLGFTDLKNLKNVNFDSVDSTTWLYGNRSGSIYKFTGNNIISIDKPTGTRLKAKAVAENNFNEWVKFQNYAETNL